MEKNIISVQIATWKRKDLLVSIIESLENQSLDRDLYEICICDSGSNDGTAEAVNLLSNKYSNIKYYNIQVNTLTAKRNYLFNKAATPLIITLDDDIVVCENFIQSHIEAHQNTQNTIFCGQVRFPPQWVKESNYYRYRDSKHLKENTKGINLTDLPAKNIVVMNMSLKKEEFGTLGFMNEQFIKYGFEDQEFGFRVKKNNFKIVYLNNALIYHLENSQLDGYLNKLYISARYGLKKLLIVMPEIEYNSSIDLLMPVKKDDNFLILLKKVFLKILLNLYIINIIKKYIKITDHFSSFYSYNLYNFICAYSLKKGINDQSEIDDNNTWI